jgi:thiol-disulfide isomerase/thioredoxin
LKPLFHALTLLLFLSLPLHAFASSPDVTLEGLDGKQHPMSEYIGNGKWVVFNIWGPGCPPCASEMPELQNLHDAHKDKDLIVVGMALDFPSFGYANKKEVQAFVEDNFITFPIVLGDHTTIQSMGGGHLQGTPTTLLFDPDGKLAAMQLGEINQQVVEDFIAKH